MGLEDEATVREDGEALDDGALLEVEHRVAEADRVVEGVRVGAGRDRRGRCRRRGRRGVAGRWAGRRGGGGRGQRGRRGGQGGDGRSRTAGRPQARHGQDDGRRGGDGGDGDEGAGALGTVPPRDGDPREVTG